MKSVVIAIALLFTGIAHHCHAEDVDMCTCSEIHTCKEKFTNSFFPCLDDCKSHASEIGADYPVFKQCLTKQDGKLKAALGCVETSFTSSCAKEGQTPPKVSKKELETVKLAAFAEVSRMAKKMGVEDDAKAVLIQGKKFYLCVMGCMDRKSEKCVKNFNCGLQLPGDEELVQAGKKCAMDNGFDTKGVKELCECAAKAGVKDLANICPKIEIS